MNTYETIYILRPNLNEEEVRQTINKVEELIKQKGEIISTENWGKKKLAYEVKKEKTGIFILTRFRASGELITDLERLYRYEDNIMRFIIVKLTKREIEALEKKASQMKPPEPLSAIDAEL